MTIGNVLEKLRPGAKWNLSGDTYEGLEWMDEKPKPSKQEVDDALEQYAYAEKRKAEYPSLADQLDAIWKGGSDMEAMRQTIAGIKVKYPKP